MDEETVVFVREFARRMRRRRRLLNLTQEEVAGKIQMSRAQYARLESARYARMQLRQLAALARVLGTSTDYLLQLVQDDPGVIPPLGRPGEGSSLDSSPLSYTTTIPERTVADEEYTSPP
jgi:transcriptional regulator with XRE-family HTH domain